MSTGKFKNKHSTGISCKIWLTTNLGSSLGNSIPENFSKITAVVLRQMSNTEFFKNKKDIYNYIYYYIFYILLRFYYTYIIIFIYTWLYGDHIYS